MTSLKDTALAHQGKKDITELDKVPTDAEVQEGKFTANKGTPQEQERKYYFMEVNGVKYSIKSAAMSKVKEILLVRPQTKFVKINKNPDGSYTVIPLD
jgi:hypothetical protein